MENSLFNREERINYIFNILLTKKPELIYLKELKEYFNSKESATLRIILKNINQLTSDLKPNLPVDWKWDRFNFLERAILINGLAEIKLFDNPKKIVINESIEYAKKYTDLKAPSLINAILDNY